MIKKILWVVKRFIFGILFIYAFNVIVFPIKTTANIIKGCIKLTDATFPSSRH